MSNTQIAWALYALAVFILAVAGAVTGALPPIGVAGLLVSACCAFAAAVARKSA